MRLRIYTAICLLAACTGACASRRACDLPRGAELAQLEAERQEVIRATEMIEAKAARFGERVNLASEPLARVHTVERTLQTTPNNGCAGQGVSLDEAAQLPFGKLKRYSVTILAAELSRARRDTDEIRVIAGVLKSGSAWDVRVARIDPGSLRSAAGVSIPPFVGTNSFVNILRGADHLGPVDVTINAYIETLP